MFITIYYNSLAIFYNFILNIILFADIFIPYYFQNLIFIYHNKTIDCINNSLFVNTSKKDNNTNNNNYIASYNNNHTNTCCYWCCHKIEQTLYGMPIKYDTLNDTYLMYGSFCSLQCANAYNFSVHCGSDLVWEINSWIQMLGKRYGILNSIRPAPSRYLLKMFNGDLSIEDFRKAHTNNEKTYILNIPPMISVTTNIEILNTSYLSKITDIKEKKNKIDFCKKK